MHTMTSTSSLVLVALCALTAPALTQEDTGTPRPAAELKKLEPLLGSWVGGGTIDEPGAGKSRWQAEGAFRWSHDGFWLQEDFVVHFADNPTPVAVRAYLGWDAENRRYVMCSASNTGEVSLNELELLPDGKMMVMAVRWNQMTYAERMVWKVDGDTMTQDIGMLLPNMALDFAEGKFERVDREPCDALVHGLFGASAGEEMQRYGRGAGVYDVEGSLVMMPGAPPMKITGTDTWTALFDGKVLHGRTEGVAADMPGKYVADVFWGWDAKRRRFTAAYVSNMGEVGSMGMWAAQGGAYVSTGAATYMGQPMVQRFLLKVDEDGTFTGGVAHTIMGLADPFESFTVTYHKRK